MSFRGVSSLRVIPAVPITDPSSPTRGILFVTFQTVKPSGWPTSSMRFRFASPPARIRRLAGTDPPGKRVTGHSPSSREYSRYGVRPVVIAAVHDIVEQKRPVDPAIPAITILDPYQHVRHAIEKLGQLQQALVLSHESNSMRHGGGFHPVRIGPERQRLDSTPPRKLFTRR